MASREVETLSWQFELVWKLARIHLPALGDEACLFEPAPGSWTVRRAADGTWRPDWAEPEPDPAPPVTIGWLTWQIVWWWSAILAALRNEKPPSYNEVPWPGSAAAAVERLESLAHEWQRVLSGLDESDLEKPLAYPWRNPRPLRLALAWVNSELMKNVAEIGYVRHLYEASRERKAP